MATKKNGNGRPDTETTLGDVVRAIQGMERTLSGRIDGVSARLAELNERVDGLSQRTEDGFKELGRRIDTAFRRDQAFESRISKLETRVAKVERKRS